MIEIYFIGKCPKCKKEQPFLFTDKKKINKPFFCGCCNVEMTIIKKGIFQLSKVNKTEFKNELTELKSLGIDKELL